MRMLPTAVVATAMFVLVSACRDPERGENGLSSSRSALTGKEVFGTYERKGEPFSGAVASIALVPATARERVMMPVR